MIVGFVVFLGFVSCLVNGGVAAVCCVLVMVGFAMGWLGCGFGFDVGWLFVVCIRWVMLLIVL